MDKNNKVVTKAITGADDSAKEIAILKAKLEEANDRANELEKKEEELKQKEAQLQADIKKANDLSTAKTDTTFNSIKAEDRIKCIVHSLIDGERNNSIFVSINEYSAEIKQGVEVELPLIIVDFLENHKTSRHVLVEKKKEFSSQFFHELESSPAFIVKRV